VSVSDVRRRTDTVARLPALAMSVADAFTAICQSVRNTHTRHPMLSCCPGLALKCPLSQQRVACLATVNRLTGPSVDC